MTPTELVAAIAKGGQITVPPGNYGDIVIKNPVALSGQGASFRTIQVVNTQDVDLSGLEITLTPDAKTVSNTAAVRVAACKNVKISKLRIRGGNSIIGVAADSDPNLPRPGDNVIGWPTGRGVSVENSQNVSVTENDIASFHKGVVLSNSPDCTVRKNKIRKTRTTPISGGGNVNCIVDKNDVGDITPWQWGYPGGKADHADMIHFWTVDKPMSGLQITDNLLDQGAGVAVLGVLLDDNHHGFGFPGVVIRGNTQLNGNTQGIRAEGVSGAIDDNVFLQTSGTVKQAPTVGLIVDVVSAAKAPGRLTGAPDGTPIVCDVTMKGNTMVDVYRTLAAKFPENTWLPATGPHPPEMLDAARKAALSKIGAAPPTVDWEAQVRILQAKIAEDEVLLAANLETIERSLAEIGRLSGELTAAQQRAAVAEAVIEVVRQALPAKA